MGSDFPSVTPSYAPSVTPSEVPSVTSSEAPSVTPSAVASSAPSGVTSAAPSDVPSVSPAPSDAPMPVAFISSIQTTLRTDVGPDPQYNLVVDFYYSTALAPDTEVTVIGFNVEGREVRTSGTLTLDGVGTQLDCLTRRRRFSYGLSSVPFGAVAIIGADDTIFDAQSFTSADSLTLSSFRTPGVVGVVAPQAIVVVFETEETIYALQGGPGSTPEDFEWGITRFDPAPDLDIQC